MKAHLRTSISAAHTFTCVMTVTLLLAGTALAETRLIQAGDEITFRRSALESTENVLTVKWQQNFQKKESDYVQTAAKFSADGKDAFVNLFIQASRKDELLEECQDKASSKCSVKVNAEYQYGQDKKKTTRFLVYHDKSFKPNQHRFVNTSIASNFAKGAKQLATDAGSAAGAVVPQVQIAVKGFNEIVGGATAMLGDSLRDF